MFRLGIIIVQYGKQTDFLRRCAERLRFTIPSDAFLIEYDNTEHNHNLSMLWNRLAERCFDCDYICFLNPDVLIPDGTFQRLIEVLDKNPDIAVVGPSSNSGPTKMEEVFSVPNPPQLSDLHRLQFAANYHAVMRGSIRDTEIFGHFYMIRRWIFDCYKWDERFSFFGQDTDLNLRLRADGFRVCQVRAAYAWHWGGYCARDVDKGEMQRRKAEALELLQRKE